MILKFIFVAVCLAVALASYIICRSKRDWRWLTLGLAFTLGADYFLILYNRHLIGVAVFCFVHVAYIMRALVARNGEDEVGFARYLPLLAVPVIGLAFIAANIFIIAGLYAMLFTINIYVSARYIRHNRVLVIAGLLLFAACDICVFIFNLPHYLGAPRWLAMVFPLIWVFYLPAQALLAVSAVDFSAKRRAAFLT